MHTTRQDEMENDYETEVTYLSLIRDGRTNLFFKRKNHTLLWPCAGHWGVVSTNKRVDIIWEYIWLRLSFQLSSVTQLCLTLPAHGLQHASLPCLSPTPKACSNSWPSWWCHPTISYSVVPFSSCLQSFPESRSFLMCQFFASGDQSIGVSASASVLPMNIQDWFPLRLTGLISLLSKGLSRVSSNTAVQNHPFFSAQLSLWSSSHIHTWLLEKPYLWLDGPLLAK